MLGDRAVQPFRTPFLSIMTKPTNGSQMHLCSECTATCGAGRLNCGGAHSDIWVAVREGTSGRGALAPPADACAFEVLVTLQVRLPLCVYESVCRHHPGPSRSKQPPSACPSLAIGSPHGQAVAPRQQAPAPGSLRMSPRACALRAHDSCAWLCLRSVCTSG